LDFVLRGPPQELEGAPSFAVFAKGGLLRSGTSMFLLALFSMPRLLIPR